MNITVVDDALGKELERVAGAITSVFERDDVLPEVILLLAKILIPILARREEAAYAKGRADERAEETGWLIEHADDPKWLTLRPGEACFEVCWTKASLEALRFARRTDAEDYVSTYFGGDGPIRITEHRWL